MPSSTLVIFDYDWSLINTNVDTYVFEKLLPENPKVVSEAMQRCDNKWTVAMDDSLAVLHDTHKDLTPSSMLETIATVPIQDGMLQAIEYAASNPEVEMHIISDANTVFIQAMLDARNISSSFKSVISNPAHFEGNRLRVSAYHDSSKYNCQNKCPANMCKGNILSTLTTSDKQIKFEKIIYVGDGSGDFCPVVSCMANNPRNVVLARDGFKLQSRLIKERGGDGEMAAKVVHWNTGLDIYTAFKKYI